MTALDVALAFVDHLEEIDSFIVGLNNLKQLDEIVNALSLLKKERIDFSSFAIEDPHIINPALWGKEAMSS